MGLKLKKKDTEREYRKFFQGWLPKMLERGQVILYNIKDHSDIKDDDWEVLKTFYRWYHFGFLPQFEPEVSQSSQKVSQQDLFTAGMAEATVENSDGTEVERSSVETNKEESDDKAKEV